MITVSDQTKANTSIIIDGVRFVRVHFKNCQLIYEARDEVDFVDCVFEQVSWTFSDAAERTIEFLATLNRKTGSEGQALVDSIFKSIKDASVTRVHVATGTAIARGLPVTVSST